MMLYTAVSHECFLSQPEALQGAVMTAGELHLKYGRVSGQYDSSGQFKVNRVISTDLSDYLNCQYNPGATIKNRNTPL